jgi:hypothetical protein
MTYGGDIAGFPLEVVELMLQRQYEQYGTRDVRVFEEHRTVGFFWVNTPEGGRFWKEVIARKNFDLFFERYPQRERSGSILNYHSWD